MSAALKKLSGFARRFWDKDMKTWYKAGYIDAGNELTDEGREALEMIILQEYKAKFTEAAKEKIADDKDEEVKEEEEEEEV